MRTILLLVAAASLGLSGCTLADRSMRVQATNPCDTELHVRFSYDDSTTLAAGGMESIAFSVPAESRAEAPHEIGTPAESVLVLEVASDQSYVNTVATRDYTDLPIEEVDGEDIVLLQIPDKACDS